MPMTSFALREGVGTRITQMGRIFTDTDLLLARRLLCKSAAGYPRINPATQHRNMEKSDIIFVIYL
jgi:hypothetical protein